MRRAIVGFGLTCLLVPGLLVAAGESPEVTAPARPGVCAAPKVPAPLEPTPQQGCSIQVTCPGGGSVVQCSARFPDECNVLFTYPDFVECGVYCSIPYSVRYCPGYDASNCS